MAKGKSRGKLRKRGGVKCPPTSAAAQRALFEENGTPATADVQKVPPGGKWVKKK